MLLQQSASGWQHIAGPAETVSGTSCQTLPQLEAGTDGTAWIMCAGPRHRQAQGTLYHWSGGHWAPITIPATVRGLTLTVGSQLTPDGRVGVV